jgi:HlyD family secretion protein
MQFLKITTVMLVVGALGGWLAYTFWHAYQPKPVRLQGQIEAQQFNISSKVAGRIDQVHVRKGDAVKKGELIFSILSPEIDAKLAQAMAGQDAAEALAEQANTGTRKEQIEASRDKWQQAKAAADLREKTFGRIDNLYTEGVVAEQKRDEALTQFTAARYAENAAYQMFKMAETGSRDETKKAAAGKARMAASAVAEIEVYAADTKIESWHDGEVTQILLQVGELAPQGFPVVAIIDMNDAWAVFNIREDRLKDFQKDMELEAVIPALGKDPYTFKVSHVAAMGNFATWRATNCDKGFDMRTFEVEARPVTPIHGLRAGMSVLIEQ